MKKIWIMALLGVASILNTMSAFACTQDICDIFMGTIIQKDGHPYLKRCSIGSDQYLIETERPDVLRQLKQLSLDHPVFWLSLLASADSKEGKGLVLSVDKILEVHPQESCHLSDSLKDFLGPEAADHPQ